MAEDKKKKPISWTAQGSRAQRKKRNMLTISLFLRVPSDLDGSMFFNSIAFCRIHRLNT
jgi:hypothetical protein